MWNALLFAWTLGGPQPQEVDPAAVFTPAPLQVAAVDTDIAALARVAAATLAYRAAVPDPVGVQAGLLGARGVDQIDATLRWIVQIAAEDAGAPTQRLRDPAFLAAHLDHWAWDPPGAPKTLRLTRYGVWRLDGRAQPAAPYTKALYATPEDALRTRFSRSELLNGVYEPGGAAAGAATPLVYLTEDGVHEANLQGTMEVHTPDGKAQLYNVDRNNEMPYLRGQPPAAQRRAWYFRPVDGVYGWGPDPSARVRIEAGVTVAGDVADLGLGRLVALQVPGDPGPTLHLAILADTGGAFAGNIGQLDYFGGIFDDSRGLYAATRALPDRLPAGLLTLRSP